jgi:uncharacterized protein (TIGR02186 family)
VIGLRFALALLSLLLAGEAARAEQLVSIVSNPRIAITSSFNGETLSIFGNVEPDEAGGSTGGPYDVIVTVTGPSVDRIARLKTNTFGIWMNTEQVEFAPFPTFYRVLASNPLSRITDEATLVGNHIRPESQPTLEGPPASPMVARFGTELVRLMTARGLFGVDDEAIRFLSPTAYAGRLELPGDISNGLFITQTFLFKDGRLLAKSADSFIVDKTGFERFIHASARDYPLLYGIVCALLALGTGWLGGVIFRR